VPIPVTSQFLSLSPQIESAWRMMSRCWCQHHIPRARDPRTVMYSWVPSERVQLPYTVENLGVHNRVAVARPLCQLIHYSCMLFSDGVWTTPSTTNAPIGDEAISLDLWLAPLSPLRQLRKSAYNIPYTQHNSTDCYRAG
jgi:hypothetical protein